MNFDFGGISKQQIEELMRSMGAGGVGQTDTDETAAGVVIQDTAEQGGGKKVGFQIDPSVPVLISPSLQLMKNPGIFNFVSQNEGKMRAQQNSFETDGENKALPADIAALFPDTGEGADLLKLATYQPGVRVLMVLTNGDASKISNLVNEYFENENILTTPPPQHPNMGKAVEYALGKHFTEMGIAFPECRADAVQQGMQLLKWIENYVDYLPNIDPTGKSMMTGQGLEKNIKVMDAIMSLNKEAIAQLKTIPDELDPGKSKMSMFEFLHFISSVIANCRQVLFEIQMEDQKNAGQLSLAQMSAITLRQDYVEQQMAQITEKLEMKETGAFVSQYMKILSPLMGSSMIMMSAIMIIMTGPVGLLALAVSVVIFVVSTCLEQTGLMDTIFNGANKALRKIGGKIFQNVFWIVIIIALVVIAILAACCPMVASTLVSILMPIITTILQHSEVLKDIVGYIGGNQTIQLVLNLLVNLVVNMGISLIVDVVKTIAGLVWQIVQQIVQLIAFSIPNLIIAVLMIILAILLAFVTSGIGTIICIVILVVLMLIQIVIALLQVIYTIITAIISGALDQLLGVIMQLIKIVIMVIQMVLTIINAAIQGLSEILQQIIQIVAKVITTLIKILQEILGKVLEILQMVKQILTLILQIIMFIFSILVQMVEATIQTLVALFQGSIKLKLAELMDQQAELARVITLLSDEIKTIGKLVEMQMGQDMSGGVNKFWEQTKELAQLFERIVRAYGAITTDLAASAV